MKDSSQSILHGPLLSGIVLYTIPIILTSVLQLLFNAADLVIVGQFCGSISVAAVGATGSLTSLLVNLFIGLSVGAGVNVAYGLGARADESVHRTVHTALPLALFCGALLTALGVLFSEPMLRLMDTPESVLSLSTIYMKIYFAGITFTIVYNFAAAILRAAGDTRSPLIFLIIAGVVNVGLNIFFVTVWDMNVAGVALATTLSQGISALLVTAALMRRTDACRLTLSKMRLYKKQLLKILKIGLPAGIQSSLFAISNVSIQAAVNSFGDTVMSGNAAAANLDAFIYVALNSIHQTAVNYVGQNIGAGQYDRVRKIVWICLTGSALFGLLLGVLSYVFARPLLSIYIPDSPEAVSYGVTRMLYICLPYFLCGLMDVSTGALRGIGEAVGPMVISVLGICGMRLVWIYTIFRIPGFHTLECLYLSYPVSWLITFVVQLIFFICAFHRRFPQAQSRRPSCE